MFQKMTKPQPKSNTNNITDYMNHFESSTSAHSFTSIPYYSFKHRGVYLILRLLGAVFISKIKTEGDEIMCQFKTIRYFVERYGVKL